MRERIGYYDLARGLGILFVVIGHIESFYMPFRQYVISFHMALFLIISGMLIKETGEEEKNYPAVVRKKFCRIMVPYFLFSILSIAIELVKLLLDGIFSWPHIRSLLLTTLTLQGISVMWFLPALFLSELLFLAIRKLAAAVCTRMGGGMAAGPGMYQDSGEELAAGPGMYQDSGEELVAGPGMYQDSGEELAAGPGMYQDSRKGPDAGKEQTAADVVTVVSVIILVLCMIWYNFLEQAFYAGHTGIEKYKRMHEILSMLIRSGFSTVFVCIGYFVRKYLISMKQPAYISGLTAMLLLAVSLIMSRINPGVELRSMSWGESDVWVGNYYITIFAKAGMYLFGAVAGALGVILLCKALDRYCHHWSLKGLAFLGTNSLIIMATHLDFHVLHVSMDLAEFLNANVQNAIFYQICILIFVFAVEVVLIWVINRYFPVLAGKNRK